MVYLTQYYHEAVKKRLLDHMTIHFDDYQPFVADDLKSKVDALEKDEVAPGLVELIILSRIYRIDFIVFHASEEEPYNVTQNNFTQEILLCSVGGNQYDLVYPKSELQTAAVCQSVLYELLYRDVFGLDSELDEAVLFLELQKELPRNNSFRDCFLSDVISLFGIEKAGTLKKLCDSSSPPLPYRIAKALHPALFRNVELDIVQEEKREARLRRLGISTVYSPGDKCQVVLEEQEDHPYNAHIQSVDEDSGTLLVFLEELGVKQTVPAKNVSPLPLDPCRPGQPSFLPVANIDFLRYLKKGRRRRNHHVMPVAIVTGHVPSSPPSERGRTISTASTNSNASSTKESSGNAPNSSKNVIELGLPNSCGKRYSTGVHAHTNSDVLTRAQSKNYKNHHTKTGIINHIGISNNNSSSVKGSRVDDPELDTVVLPSLVPVNGFYNNAIPGGYSPVYEAATAVSYGETTEYTLESSDAGPVESCPLTVSFTPACPPPPGPGGYIYHHPNQHQHQQQQQQQSHLMTTSTTGSSVDAAVTAHIHHPQQQHQSGYWMPVVAVPFQQPVPAVTAGAPGSGGSGGRGGSGGDVGFWSPQQDGFAKDVNSSDSNVPRFFFNPGVEYYRLSSNGPPAPSCYPQGGVMFTPSPSNPAPRGTATAGTAVMVDASGNHHYTSVLYTPQELPPVDPHALPAAVCVGQQGAAPAQVMFMAYPASTPGYQQPVLVSPSCPVPVQ